MIIQLPDSFAKPDKVYFTVEFGKQLMVSIYCDLLWPRVMVTDPSPSYFVYGTTIGGANEFEVVPNRLRFSKKTCELVSLTLDLSGGPAKSDPGWDLWKNATRYEGTLILSPPTSYFFTGEWILRYGLDKEQDVVYALFDIDYSQLKQGKPLRIQVHQYLDILLLDDTLVGWVVSDYHKHISYNVMKDTSQCNSDHMALARELVYQYLELIWEIDDPDMDDDLRYGEYSERMFRNFKPIVDRLPTKTGCSSLDIVRYMARVQYSRSNPLFNYSKSDFPDFNELQ